MPETKSTTFPCFTEARLCDYRLILHSDAKISRCAIHCFRCIFKTLNFVVDDVFDIICAQLFVQTCTRVIRVHAHFPTSGPPILWPLGDVHCVVTCGGDVHNSVVTSVVTSYECFTIYGLCVVGVFLLSYCRNKGLLLTAQRPKCVAKHCNFDWYVYCETQTRFHCHFSLHHIIWMEETEAGLQRPLCLRDTPMIRRILDQNLSNRFLKGNCNSTILILAS